MPMLFQPYPLNPEPYLSFPQALMVEPNLNPQPAECILYYSYGDKVTHESMGPKGQIMSTVLMT